MLARSARCGMSSRLATTPRLRSQKPILKAELKALDAQLAAAAGKTSERMTKAHLEDARDQIGEILHPNGK